VVKRDNAARRRISSTASRARRSASSARSRQAKAFPRCDGPEKLHVIARRELPRRSSDLLGFVHAPLGGYHLDEQRSDSREQVLLAAACQAVVGTAKPVLGRCAIAGQQLEARTVDSGRDREQGACGVQNSVPPANRRIVPADPILIPTR
jgi:hypothetical protein